MKIDRVRKSTKLNVETRRPDLRRDLHIFAAYVCARKVKRSHHGNRLSKSDVKRLARLFSDPDAESEIAERGDSEWIDLVDAQALHMDLVNYDTEGEYAGYTSQEPSFPDNFIELNAKAYAKLASMTLAQQETMLLDSLLKEREGCGSEFFGRHVLARLDGFDDFGCGTGVVPQLDFHAIRRFLLERLAECPTGEWLSVASLIEHLKQNDPYFLIPRNPEHKKIREKDAHRYCNFYESEKQWGRGETVNEKDADAFERVEGRYIERFLEGIPNLLGYVDVSYAAKQPKVVYPSFGLLKAFRVSERLKLALQGTIPEPTIRVTPSFDVYVQSELYPSRVMRELLSICHLVSEDTTTVLRLDRQKVAAACAENSKLDVTSVLQSLTTEPLPANVQRELGEWSAHSDKFVLYTGCSLLESKGRVADIDKFIVENVAPGIDVVRKSEKLYDVLESQQLAPYWVEHPDDAFSPMPPKFRSAFPRKSAAKKKKKPPRSRIALMRTTRIELLCPDRHFLDRLRTLLAEANCPVEADSKRLSLAYSSRFEKDVSGALKTLGSDFDVSITEQ